MASIIYHILLSLSRTCIPLRLSGLIVHDMLGVNVFAIEGMIRVFIDLIYLDSKITPRIVQVRGIFVLSKDITMFLRC